MRLTFAGKLFVGVTIGVGLAAVNTGNNLLYLVLGLMLSLLLFSGVMSELSLFRVKVERRLPERAFAGITTLIEIRLTNRKKRIASYSLEVQDHAENEGTERRCYFLKLKPLGQQSAAYRRTPIRRGLLKLSGYRLSTRHPFGLIEKSWIIDAPDELLVYPQLVRISPESVLGAIDMGHDSSGRPGVGTEFGSLREFRPDDDARRIHWKRSASLGRLVSRETERDSMGRITLVLDNAIPDAHATTDHDDAQSDWAERFEYAISVTASLAAYAVQRRAAVDVVVRGQRSPLVLPGQSPDAIWRFLAHLGAIPASEAAAFPEFARGAYRVPLTAPPPSGSAPGSSPETPAMMKRVAS